MVERFDVVIVGARCAGSPLAALLARRGMRVCVLDKARFPSETPSTHVIQPSGAGALERMGALDAVLAAGAVPLDRLTLVNEDVRVDGRLDRSVFPLPGLCVRRVTLDGVLVEAAARAGAEIRTGTKVTGLIRRDGRVAGVETVRGPVQADLVVGADGRRSRVAAEAGARQYDVVPGGRTPAWAYFEGVDDRTGHLRLGRIGEYAYLACPTDSGLYMAAVATGPGSDATPGSAFGAGIAAWPELAGRLADARRVGPVRVMTRWHGYFRQACGPGWVLVGDAGHFKDFTPAQGIADAFRQAERLAGVLPADVADHPAVDAALRAWWRRRDRDAYPMYWFATDMGAPGPSTPLVTEVLRDIAADRDATLALLRVLNHEIRPDRLLTGRRLARAAARALRDRPGQRRATVKEIATGVREEIRRVRRRQAGTTMSGSISV